jgi:hypothetical protein
LEWH